MPLLRCNYIRNVNPEMASMLLNDKQFIDKHYKNTMIYLFSRTLLAVDKYTSMKDEYITTVGCTRLTASSKPIPEEEQEQYMETINGNKINCAFIKEDGQLHVDITTDWSTIGINPKIKEVLQQNNSYEYFVIDFVDLDVVLYIMSEGVCYCAYNDINNVPTEILHNMKLDANIVCDDLTTFPIFFDSVYIIIKADEMNDKTEPEMNTSDLPDYAVFSDKKIILIGEDLNDELTTTQ